MRRYRLYWLQQRFGGKSDLSLPTHADNNGLYWKLHSRKTLQDDKKLKYSCSEAQNKWMMCIEYKIYLLETVSGATDMRTRHSHQGDTLQIKPGYKGPVRCVFNTIMFPRKDIRAKKALEVFSWKGEIPVTCTVLQNKVLSVPTFPDVLSTKRSGYEIRDSHVASRFLALRLFILSREWTFILWIKIFRS